MKLLIVDDEHLTRNGIINSIDWDSLGIFQIDQADDGINGMQIARQEQPQIILCDIRMPRMNGIQMIEKLEQQLPDASIILMSGYSDKEYLKAAIRLKVINYVEKPINPSEVIEAIDQAKERYHEKIRTRKNELFQTLGTSSSLALLLTRPYASQKEIINAHLKELAIPITNNMYFTTYLIKLNLADPDPSLITDIGQVLADFLTSFQTQIFYVSKHQQYHVFHLYHTSLPSNKTLSEIDQYLTVQYLPVQEFFISRGNTVTGISKVFHSYTLAVTLIQTGFYYPCRNILTSTSLDQTKDSFIHSFPFDSESFADLLMSKDKVGCQQLLDQYYHYFYKNQAILPTKAKDFYYKLFMVVQETQQALKLPINLDEPENPESMIEFLEHCFSYDQLHRSLCNKINCFFNTAESCLPENSTIFLIKDYIKNNYSNDALSVQEISDHVFLSISYVCTYFKNETGQTLNQYLTLYRIEKAKKLLKDPRYQISDVSSRVGYSNGNYFSKSFKKLVGLSPSEYREKII